MEGAERLASACNAHLNRRIGVRPLLGEAGGGCFQLIECRGQAIAGGERGDAFKRRAVVKAAGPRHGACKMPLRPLLTHGLMHNAFEILGIVPSLTIAEENLRSAFREAGKLAHPDAGGGDDEFAKLREAFEIVSSPSRRLKHWLELRGTPAETRGTVDPLLMDLFGQVGEVTQRAEHLIRRRDQTKSALGLAMLERETHVCREAVEKAISQVEASIARESAVFPEIENADSPDVEAASKIARNLAFLEKWRAGLRSVFSRLV